MLKIAEQRLTKNIISFFIDKSSMSTRIENWSKIDGERSVSAFFAINKERKMRRLIVGIYFVLVTHSYHPIKLTIEIRPEI